MEQTGEYRIAASRLEVWHALNDPEILARCIDGCEDMQKISDTRFESRVKAKVGPVRATFGAEIVLSDIQAPESYVLTVSAKGGAAGFGKGVARVELTEESSDTLLRYSVEAQVGGKLAQVGSRLIDGAARKMADDFFEKFREVVAPTEVLEQEAEPTYEASGRWMVWVVVFVILVLALVLAL